MWRSRSALYQNLRLSASGSSTPEEHSVGRIIWACYRGTEEWPISSSAARQSGWGLLTGAFNWPKQLDSGIRFFRANYLVKGSQTLCWSQNHSVGNRFVPGVESPHACSNLWGCEWRSWEVFYPRAPPVGWIPMWLSQPALSLWQHLPFFVERFPLSTYRRHYRAVFVTGRDHCWWQSWIS